jgi:hypothetical protein
MWLACGIARPYEIDHTATLAAVLGASVALAGLLVVFEGFLLSSLAELRGSDK